MEWEAKAQEKFKAMISKMPLFHRGIAESAVSSKAGENARERGAAQVEEEDIISAFFSDVPKPFYGMMVRLMEQSSFDYKKYGFPRQG